MVSLLVRKLEAHSLVIDRALSFLLGLGVGGFFLPGIPYGLSIAWGLVLVISILKMVLPWAVKHNRNANPRGTWH